MLEMHGEYLPVFIKIVCALTMVKICLKVGNMYKCIRVINFDFEDYYSRIPNNTAAVLFIF